MSRPRYTYYRPLAICLATMLATAQEAALPAENWLRNGDMEQGQSAPEAWDRGAPVRGVEYRWDRDQGERSRASLCLHKTVHRFLPVAQWSQTVARRDQVPAVRVGAHVKATDVTKAVIDLAMLDAEKQWIEHQWVLFLGAAEAGSPPVTHEWKAFEKIVPLPESARWLEVRLQIYGPGTVWFDNLRVEPVAEADASVASPSDGSDADDDGSLPAREMTVPDHERMRYFFIGPRRGTKAPADGYKLLVVLPGGDGGAGYRPFVRRMRQRALGDDYLVAQPMAVTWQPAQQIIWPTRSNPAQGQQFSTETFVQAVIDDVARRHAIDWRFVSLLAWSSGGPAAYAVALTDESPVRGAYIAMSVFQPAVLPPLENARGGAFFIDHSPQDAVCPIRMAKHAAASLREHGAAVRLDTYQGGHGWHGDAMGRIRRGMQWLAAQAKAAELPEPDTSESGAAR